jgi:hypothetical protein
VSIVTTSNFHPDGLYPNGLHRDRILPAIELLKEHLEVVNVDAGNDYRRRTLSRWRCTTARWGRGRCGDGAVPSTNWPRRATRTRCCTSSTASCAHGGAPAACVVRLPHPVRRPALAERLPRDWPARFHTVLLSERAADAARLASEARRFTWLVDVLYDRRVKLVVSAAVPARAALHRGAAGARVPAHRQSRLRRDAVGRVPGTGAARGADGADLSAVHRSNRPLEPEFIRLVPSQSQAVGRGGTLRSMLHAAEVPMLKSKTGWLLTAMALAVGLSLSPAAEGSELAKLGRLIVTGKRAPSADAGKAGTLPAAPGRRALEGVWSPNASRRRRGLWNWAASTCPRGWVNNVCMRRRCRRAAAAPSRPARRPCPGPIASDGWRSNRQATANAHCRA